MKTRNQLIVIIVSFLAFVGGLYAYNISGTTLAELAKQFNAGGSGYAAVTTWNYTYTYKHKKVNSKCPGCTKKFAATISANTAKFEVTTSIDMPKWTNQAAACQKIQTEWNRFIAALKVHEDGHVKIVEDFKKDKFKEYEDKINNLTGTGCSDESQAAADKEATDKIAADAKKIADDMGKALQDLNDKYDKDTGHGATQGATLDTSIVCP